MYRTTAAIAIAAALRAPVAASRVNASAKQDLFHLVKTHELHTVVRVYFLRKA
jgi:hypothetical protein